MGGKKEPKKLTKAQQEQLDAKNREKAIEDVWKACKNDKGAIVTKALTLGYTLDYADPDHGHTALHRAAAFSAMGVIRVLHKAGASLDTKNKSKETPLDTAKAHADESTVKLLEALLSGKSGDDIVAEEDEDEDQDTGDAPAEASESPIQDAPGEAADAAPPTQALESVALE